VTWRTARHVAARLPARLLPRWLETRLQPVALSDVIFALRRALDLPVARAGIYDLPGPEVLSAKEILLRTATIPRELVEGLHCDLLSSQKAFWDFCPEHRLVPFIDAARTVLEEHRPHPRGPGVSGATAWGSRGDA
jgi:uncharacterized protein YbjT (DUF2867 family)